MFLSLSFLVQTFLIQTFNSRPNLFRSVQGVGSDGSINDLEPSFFDQPAIGSVARLHLMSIRGDQKKHRTLRGLRGSSLRCRRKIM
jgi:hypothetical protein